MTLSELRQLSVTSDTLPRLGEALRRHLLDDIMPFWERHALDPAGGINTCIADDGTVLSRDKWLWSQWRAVWVYSKLYNDIEPRQEWLDIARNIHAFCARFGWDDKAQGWLLRVDGDGNRLDGCDSIYTDGFAMYGLAELTRAIGHDADAVALARRTADSVLERMKAPHDQIPHFPYPIPPGARVHGLPMMSSLNFWELGEALDEDRYRQAGATFSDEIFDHFYRPDRDVILERIGADHSELPPPLGTVIVPGHVVEDMWFQIHIARDQGKSDRVRECVRLIRRHMELGWDETEGGLFLAVDADGRKEIGWNHAETKLWWPHTEAMYALLLAHALSGEDWCLQWYQRVHDYSFRHYPVPEHGEWRQKLDRFGKPITQTVALPVKDPFHLPRALILCIELIDRMKV